MLVALTGDRLDATTLAASTAGMRALRSLTADFGFPSPGSTSERKAVCAIGAIVKCIHKLPDLHHIELMYETKTYWSSGQVEVQYHTIRWNTWSSPIVSADFLPVVMGSVWLNTLAKDTIVTSWPSG